jgi:Trk K+ transport system NAD-binding subunit
LLALVVGIPLFLVVAALLYMAGMAYLEGSPRGFWRSLEWAGETISTTGYGADATWSHPVMVLYVIALQLVGVFLVFLIVPIFLVPFLEERFEEKLPRDAGRIDHHVIVYRYGPAVETLLDSLAERSIPVLVLETDETVARSLVERGIAVVFSRAEEQLLEVCNLRKARAFVANGRDEENGAMILRARQAGFKGDIFSLVEEPVHRRPMELAGATAAYTPRHILAAALAARASEELAPRINGLAAIPGARAVELRVTPAALAHGKHAGDLPLPADVVAVAQWQRGALSLIESAQTIVDPGSILVAVTRREHLDAIEAGVGLVPLDNDGPVLIAGFGEVGQKIGQLLTDMGENVRVVDRRAGAGIDFVGNVLDPSVLRAASLGSCSCVILALDSDDATMFGTVIAREIAPMVRIIARVNHQKNVDNIYRAGADYALSISEISGQMLSYRLLHDRPRPAQAHLRAIAVDGSRFAGQRSAQINLAGRPFAVRRSGVAEIGADLPIEGGDEVLCCVTAASSRE